MNYMTEIKLFYDWLETHQLTPASISLWHGLMFIANRSGWKSPLYISASLIEFRTGITRSTLKRERKKLVEAGLITVEFGKGRGRTSYRLRSLTEHFVAQIEPQNEPQTIKNDETVHFAVHSEPQSVPPIIYKLNYTESNKEKSEKESLEKMEVGGEPPPNLSPEEKKERKSCAKKKAKREAPHLDTEAILQTIEPPWREAMRTWLEYKRLRKESYKSEIGIRKCLTMLCNLSGGNPQTATAIIDLSIANNWAGLFELKRSAYTPRGQPATGQHIGQIKQPETEEQKNRILEKFGKSKK